MSRNPQPFAFLVLAALLTGCGQAYTPTLTARTTSAIVAQAIPPASAFVTVSGKVKQVLPLDNKGLPHQNFILISSEGRIYEVNNDTKYGSEVPGLKAGMSLIIKGTVYKNKKKQGLHWTHHANEPGDAGWIKTPDGAIFE